MKKIQWRKSPLVYCFQFRSIYEFDYKHSRLFTVPTRIAASTSDTFVLDMKKKDNGRIVALNPKGNLKWIYSGCTSSEDVS
jgi:hypothetical protein